MSGPVSEQDAPTVSEPVVAAPPEIEITVSRSAQVGDMPVRRALPRRARRTVGAWCFVDHMGPAQVTADRGIDVGPHPHIGLQTVTWLFTGEVLHRDSLGSEQLIRPGQLNLMTAGGGVAHAEEGTGAYAGQLHGVQLWVAQPQSTRSGAPAFEHHAELPRVDLDHGAATVLVGALGGVESPARRDTDHLGLELELGAGSSTIELEPNHEHAMVVGSGSLEVDGAAIEPGHLAYLGLGRDEITFTAAAPSLALLIGGAPFPEKLLMWWNYVGRSREEISQAHRAWTQHDERFGSVASRLARIGVGPPPWDSAR
jgi:redox-sensitive bicupin YhaK (pirin superfamily)